MCVYTARIRRLEAGMRTSQGVLLQNSKLADGAAITPLQPQPGANHWSSVAEMNAVRPRNFLCGMHY